MRLQSDERLVELARAGSESAFAAMVDRYRGALERYAGRLLGPDRAEDAVQQAFINAHTAMTDTDRPLKLRPWLYRIVHNVALNVLRSSRDDARLADEGPGAPASPHADPHELAESREQLNSALTAIAALPAAQRDAILLREVEGRSHEEIAVALGVTSGAARQHLFRARAALRSGFTALTPVGLLMRLVEAGGPGGGAEIATGAGVGLGAAALKTTGAVVAAGALVGGAVGTGVIHHTAASRHASAAPHSARPAPAAVPIPVRPTAVVAEPRSRPTSSSTAGRDLRATQSRRHGGDHKGSSGPGDGRDRPGPSVADPGHRGPGPSDGRLGTTTSDDHGGASLTDGHHGTTTTDDHSAQVAPAPTDEGHGGSSTATPTTVTASGDRSHGDSPLSVAPLEQSGSGHDGSVSGDGGSTTVPAPLISGDG